MLQRECRGPLAPQKCRDGIFLFVCKEVVEFAAVFFCGAADLALALAGVEARGLELEAFDLFGRGNVDIVVDGLGVLEAMVEEAGDFDAPAFVFGFDFVFVADADGL